MKVIRTKVKGAKSSTLYRANQKGVDGALVEVRVFLEESLNDGSMSLEFDEMTEEEYEGLPDFEGY